MPEQAQIQVGYPDFWPVILNRHPKFFEITQDLGSTVDALFSKAHTKAMHRVCRQLAKMVANSLCSVLLLGMNGFGNDALKVARSMFEAAVTVAYLRKNPNEFDDYFDFHFIVAMRRHQYMEKYSPESLAKVTAEKQSHPAKLDTHELNRGTRTRKEEYAANGAENAFRKSAPSWACTNITLPFTTLLRALRTPTSPG
jgi:hypothetical protein